MSKKVSHFENLTGLLDSWKTRGESSIPITVIEKAISLYEHEMEVWRVSTSIEAQIKIEMFKATVESGQTAIKSLTIINGGAAIALLAFMGNALNKDKPIDITGFHYPLMIFVIGVGLAGLTSALRYLSQDGYNYKSWIGLTFKLLAAISGLCSLVLFMIGAMATSGAFQSI